jgi:hypothetical protein
MVKNPPEVKDEKKGRATTLILAPLALLDQWKAEIEHKTNLDLRILVYHGPWLVSHLGACNCSHQSLSGANKNKIRKENDFSEYDFVLTTYTVRRRIHSISVYVDANVAVRQWASSGRIPMRRTAARRERRRKGRRRWLTTATQLSRRTTHRVRSARRPLPDANPVRALIALPDLPSLTSF